MYKLLTTLKKPLKKSKDQIEPEEQALKDILKENIKKYRKRRNLSQFALASKIDLSTNFLADIEAGNTWVSAQTLQKLANAFGIEAFELLKPEKKELSPKEQKEINQSKELMNSFSNDLSEILKNSLDKSIDHLKKQYFP
jgi:transcriptional regulator with XRE-family HTH domain